MRASLVRLAFALSLLVAGCNGPRVIPMFDAGPRDAAAVVDANRADAPGTDAATVDSGVPVDAGGDDAAVDMDAAVEIDAAVGTDAGTMDAGMRDGGTSDAGRDAATSDAGRDAGMAGDAGMLTTSGQIAAIRAAAIGAMDRPIDGAIVTYVHPLLGTDAAGFFVQADMAGPALFVAVTPSTLSPVPVAGDVVSFRVTMTATDHVQIRATAITSFTRTSTGADVSALVQDVSSASDLVSGVTGYESEIVRVRGTLGAVGASGTGHQRAPLSTVGVPASASLLFRAPDAIWTSFMLVQGCDVTIDATPLWRYDALSEPSAWDSADLVVNSCPRPRVVSASATSSTTVAVTFDQPLSAATVIPTAFTLTGGASVSGASVTGAVVTLTTSALTAMTTYTVTAAATITSARGDGVDPAMNTAMFTTAGAMSTDHLVINEVNYDDVGAGDSTEFVEILNRTGATVDLSRFAVTLINGATGAEYARVPLTGMLPDGGYAVLASGATLATITATVEITIPGTTNLVQNGDPDGLALLDLTAGTVVDAVCYGGAMMGLTVAGISGTVSLVEGTMTSARDSNSVDGALCRRPNGSDTNDASSDWAFCSARSPAAANP
jgi:hypothetical protein